MKKLFHALKYRFVFIIFIFMLLIIIASGNQRYAVITNNMNRTKSVEAIHIVTKYNNILDEAKPVLLNQFENITTLGSKGPVQFTGTMTGYGPDCVGCGGRVGCPPRQNVQNGNIYFQDVDYGKIRIVATDPAIPCGTIIKIGNLRFTKEPIIAIALDRGGAIRGPIMDLLYASEAETVAVGRQKNVSYEIVRWGW